MLVQPRRGFADVHVEYGGLYVVEIERDEPFVVNDEIAARHWWDGSPLEDLSPLDHALVRQASAHRHREEEAGRRV